MRLSTSARDVVGHALDAQGRAGEDVDRTVPGGVVRARDAPPGEQRRLLRPVPEAAVAVQVLAHVGDPQRGVLPQLVLQRDVDLVDVLRREVGVDRRPARAELRARGAQLGELGAQLVRTVVDPVAVRVEERVADPRRAGGVGGPVGVGEVDVVAAVVPLQHRALGERERQPEPRRPGVPDDARVGRRSPRSGRSRRSGGATPRPGSRCAAARSGRPGSASAVPWGARCPGRTPRGAGCGCRTRSRPRPAC